MSGPIPHDIYGSNRGLPFKNDGFAHEGDGPIPNQDPDGQNGKGLGDALKFCTKKSKQVAKELYDVAKGKKSASALGKFSNAEIKDAMACAKFDAATKSALSQFQKGSGFVSDFLNFGPSTNADSPFSRMVGLPTGSFSNSEMRQLLPYVKRLNPQAGSILGLLLQGKEITEQDSPVSGKQLFSLLKEARSEVQRGRGRQMPNPSQYGKDDHIEFASNSKSRIPATSDATPKFN